jgi:hypothetical protein
MDGLQAMPTQERTSTNMTSDRSFKDYEVVTIAVYLLGGDTQYVDTEDAAVKSREIAPGRFAWRKYPEQINIKTVAKRLWDAKQDDKGGYLIGSEREGWMLTESGLCFSKQKIGEFKNADHSRTPLKPEERKWRNNEYIRMLSNVAYSKYQAGGTEAVSMQEAEAFFRLDDYITGSARERKLIRLINTFGEDEKLGKVIKDLSSKVRKGEK